MVLTVDGIGGGSFDVLVRTVDSEDDVRVFARPGALAMEFKAEQWHGPVAYMQCGCAVRDWRNLYKLQPPSSSVDNHALLAFGMPSKLGVMLHKGLQMHGPYE